ncbi:hypothetical protein [Nereida sp. MMG025]|uniref:hypothetical protein n=1 Tax=Nereida sp. MMG025 TaxID=2909981 RepID=UPI001F1C8081|nr:hypothetical protein [Nereida sp. MMG025]MCF6444007.1 hypothetical protein [Nereida sp. MMG025]
MTALKEYALLESTGLWRATKEAQRREVIVSFGDASLVISDTADRILSHWSLAAITRLNVGTDPAIFTPDDAGDEQLELTDETMINAIEKVQKAIEKSRPHPGRLRWALLAGSVAVVGWVGLFWLPDALTHHTLSVVPEVKRAQIGAQLEDHIGRLAGPPCALPEGRRALAQLSQRLELSAVPIVHKSGLPDTLQLPGGQILINAPVIEDFDDVEVTAGYLVAETLRSDGADPLEPLLRFAGLRQTFRLLTTASMPDDVLRRYAEALVKTTPAPLPMDRLQTALAQAGVGSAPLGYALDPSGETTLPLIEADQGTRRTLLSDGQWIALQGICGA